MNPKRRSLLMVTVLSSATVLLSLPLMYRSQTVIDIPEAGKDVELSRLSYKANAFEAKLTTVRLDPKGAAEADPYAASWNFRGSNNDGQMHKLEVWVRLLDGAGKQVAMYSGKCVLAPAAHDQPCVVNMEIKAETWKTIKSARLVADWLS